MQKLGWYMSCQWLTCGRGLSLRGNGSDTQAGEEGVGVGRASGIPLSEGALELICRNGSKVPCGPLAS